MTDTEKYWAGAGQCIPVAVVKWTLEDNWQELRAFRAGVETDPGGAITGEKHE